MLRQFISSYSTSVSIRRLSYHARLPGLDDTTTHCRPSSWLGCFDDDVAGTDVTFPSFGQLWIEALMQEKEEKDAQLKAALIC